MSNGMPNKRVTPSSASLLGEGTTMLSEDLKLQKKSPLQPQRGLFYLA